MEEAELDPPVILHISETSISGQFNGPTHRIYIIQAKTIQQAWSQSISSEVKSNI